MKYDVSSIVEMSELDHLRHNSGMYVGDSETATRLLEEVLDNALDEVQANHATIIGVFVDTKKSEFAVLDNGRGFPFDQKLPLEQDPPVLACTKLFTSGKFNKGDDKSAYGIAVGLHGIGLVCCFALSEYMKIEVYRNEKHAQYSFTHAGEITRDQEKWKDKNPYSTRILVKPSKKYFASTNIDLKKIERRLKIAVANYPNLKVAFRIDETNQVIDGTEKDLILDVIGKNVNKWITLKGKKSPETYKIQLAWDDFPPTTPKHFSTINLCEVPEGAHLILITKIIREFFQDAAKKAKVIFQPNDALVGLRAYTNLKLLKPAFAEQVKHRLSSNSDLTILTQDEKGFRGQLEAYFLKHPALLEETLNRFALYRASLTNKKLASIGANTGTKRVMTTLTKLHDCTQLGGELLICEGDSAGGSLMKCRDAKRHAVLGLRGVVPNAITNKNFHTNKELKDIIIACGCGVGDQCDVTKLRYDKVIIAADADPAGNHITTLLIVLFASIMAPVIKAGRLYVCDSPLYAYRDKKKLIPIWSEEELTTARDANRKLLRFKGLGEFDAADLKVVAMDRDTRKIIQLQWSEEHKDSIFRLLSSPSDRRDLVLNKWKL